MKGRQHSESLKSQQQSRGRGDKHLNHILRRIRRRSSINIKFDPSRSLEVTDRATFNSYDGKRIKEIVVENVNIGVGPDDDTDNDHNNRDTAIVAETAEGEDAVPSHDIAPREEGEEAKESSR